MSDLGSRRWWALGAVFLTILCVGVDSTVLSVALPTLAKSLHASETDLQWFSSGYFLVLAAAMLPFGLLGDRYVVVGGPSIAGTAAAVRRFALSNTSNGPSPASVTSAPAIPGGISGSSRRSRGRDVGQNVAAAALR
jgi:MFS family permease